MEGPRKQTTVRLPGYMLADLNAEARRQGISVSRLIEDTRSHGDRPPVSANLAFGGKAIFDTDNLTFVYQGGLRDKIFDNETAWGAYAVFGDNSLYPPTDYDNSILYSHELHHLWQSRAMGNIFLTNYGVHGFTSLIGRGNFLEKMNFYEQIAYFHYWYK